VENKVLKVIVSILFGLGVLFILTISVCELYCEINETVFVWKEFWSVYLLVLGVVIVCSIIAVGIMWVIDKIWGWEF